MDLPFRDLWFPALRNRMVLFANHVLTACQPAVDRLRPHAGKCINVDVTGWPSMVPAPPPLTLRITPAGLFEAVEGAELTDELSANMDLRVRLDASAPGKLAESLVRGRAPAMGIEGDAALASDFSWIAQHVRWDPAADAERFFGPFVGEGVARMGTQFEKAAEFAKDAANSLLDAINPRKPQR